MWRTEAVQHVVPICDNLLSPPEPFFARRARPGPGPVLSTGAIVQGFVASSFSLLVFTRKLVFNPSISLRKLTDLLLKPVGRRTMWRSEAVQYVLLICDALPSTLESFSPEAGPSRTRSSKLPQQNHPLSPLHEPLHWRDRRDPKTKCFLCSPFYGRACHWAMSG